MISRPKMVPVAWRARVHPNEVPAWWQWAAADVWWVLGDCKHWQADPTEPLIVRSTRTSGPCVVKCYECGRKA